MPQNEATTIDPISGGTFSRLLFSDTEVDDAVTLLNNNNTTFTFSSHDQKPPKMLCFGQDKYVSQKNSTTLTNDHGHDKSLSPSSSNMKRNMGCDYYQPVVLSTSVTTTTTTTTGATVAPSGSNRRSNKKMKAENTPPASHAKVKKEKLGERIAALQQIVSPYGKTDTASVLHEALGYIKFLQEQVQVLCSPYMKLVPATHIEGQEDRGGQRKKELQRGLCLVPVECTLHVAESNGADMWSTAMVNHHGSSALR